MSKPSKITVKHYLNTRLKPDVDGKRKIYPLYLSITYDRMNVRTPSQINNGVSASITENDFLKNKIDRETLFKLNYEADLFQRCIEIFIKDENLKHLRKDYNLLYSLKKYRSKNERFNIFNSYLDFYTHSIYEAIAVFLHDQIKLRLIEKIDNDVKEFNLLDDKKLQFLLQPNNPDLYKLITKYDLGFKYEAYYILWSRFHSFLAFEGQNYGYDMPYIDWKQGIGQVIFKDFLKTYKRDTDCWNTNFFNDNNIDFLIKTIENVINNENYFQYIVGIYNI